MLLMLKDECLTSSVVTVVETYNYDNFYDSYNGFSIVRLGGFTEFLYTIRKPILKI